MADIVLAQNEQIPTATQTRYRDMGDGTHAPVVSATVGGAAGDVNADIRVGGAAVTNANPVPISDAGSSLTVDQATHDNLNANANMQVGNADVANGNPVPISDAGGSLTVDQATHDNLNANANLQIGDADAALTNPVPVAARNPVTVITQTPTVTAGAYVAGDAVGGLLTFADAALAAGRGGTIVKVLLVDDAGQAVPYELHLFDQTFTAMADNGTWTPSDADMQNWEGFVDVAATDQAAGTANSGAAKSTGLRCPFPYYCVGTSLFGQLVTRGAPTYAATDDITVKLYVERW